MLQSLEDIEKDDIVPTIKDFTLVENAKLTYFIQLKKHLLLVMNVSTSNPIKIISVNM